MDSPPLFVSVVIPVLNEAASLESVVRELLDQEYPADMFEVLVVDGGSTDDTVSIASDLSRSHSNLRVLPNPGRLSSAGRNVGAREARGDVVMFVDGHCEIPDRLLLKSLSELVRRTGADVFCRPQPLETAGLSSTQRAIALARTSRLGHNPGSHIFAENEEGYVDPESSGAAYTRRVFDTIGFFDETFDACEDVDFNLRAREAGLKAFTSPRLTVRYRPRESIGGLYRQMLRYGSGRARLFAKHPRRGLVGALLLGAPPLVVAALAVGSAFSPGAGYTLLGLALAYVFATAAASAVLSAGKGIGLAPRVFAAFLATHSGLVAGFWKRLFEGLPTGGSGADGQGNEGLRAGRPSAPAGGDPL